MKLSLPALCALALAAAVSFAVSAVRAQDGAAPGDAKPTPETPTKESAPVHVKMTTSMGDIYLELDEAKAPISVENFLAYVDKGHYDGTVFHRIIPTFMIQGGGFTADLSEKPTDKAIKNEWKNGLKNTRGSIAMARRGNLPDSATSQFFINVVDNAMLDQPRDGAGYAVFGKVVSGMDVVDKIKVVKTGQQKGMGDVPVETVTMQKVVRVRPEEIPSSGAGGTPEKTDEGAKAPPR